MYIFTESIIIHMICIESRKHFPRKIRKILDFKDNNIEKILNCMNKYDTIRYNGIFKKMHNLNYFLAKLIL